LYEESRRDIQEGKVIKGEVVQVDKENERFSLGIKQLTPDPWDKVPERYKRGARVSGTVTNVTHFGVFVELEKGIEGLIHVWELPKKKGENPLEQFQVGSVVKAIVTRVSREDKRLWISLNKGKAASKKTKPKAKAKDKGEVASNVGEALKEAMNNPWKRERKPRDRYDGKA